ncbi:MAG: NAD(P)/FAD-dependent oxidoreductase [Parafilimonas sp.]
MDLPKLKNEQKRVVIAGAGFAGLKLAKSLSSKYFQVILLDKNNYHQFQPLLYQVATCGLEPSSISFPLRKIFQRKKNVFIRIAEVTGVETEKQVIKTNFGEIQYDYLALAYGATTNFFNNQQLQKNAFSMKSVSEALLLRNTLLQNYEMALIAKTDEERKALLNVVIVGGGPTGVELAGAVAEMKMKILPKDYSELNFRQMNIYLLEAAPKLLGGMSAGLGKTVEEYLTELGVEVKINSAVKDYDGENVLLSDGSVLKSNCLIWAAGVKGTALAGIPSTSLAANERLIVDEYNCVKDVKNVFAIGDIAFMQSVLFPKGHPQVAPVAIQQAKLLALNLKNISIEKNLVAFKYRDKGSMATVGRNKAVAETGKIKLKGFTAWFAWMMVHLMSIIGTKNRLFILINWVWQYFTYDPSLRLIIKPTEIKYTRKLVKYAAAFIVVSGLLMACHTSENKEIKLQPEQTTEHDTFQENENATGLFLHDGAKWRADRSTNENVSALNNIINTAQPVTAEDYQNIGISLQAGINKMISECKMQGPDHEALHHWLEPIIENNKKLQEAKTIDEGTQTFDLIKKQINLYPNFFE